MGKNNKTRDAQVVDYKAFNDFIEKEIDMYDFSHHTLEIQFLNEVKNKEIIYQKLLKFYRSFYPSLHWMGFPMILQLSIVIGLDLNITIAESKTKKILKSLYKTIYITGGKIKSIRLLYKDDALFREYHAWNFNEFKSGMNYYKESLKSIADDAVIIKDLGKIILYERLGIRGSLEILKFDLSKYYHLLHQGLLTNKYEIVFLLCFEEYLEKWQINSFFKKVQKEFQQAKVKIKIQYMSIKDFF